MDGLLPVDGLLSMTLSLAVPLKIHDIQSGRCPITLGDLVPCEWCGAPGCLGLVEQQCRYTKANKCLVCNGTGKLQRTQRNAHLIANKGDVLMYGGKKGEAAMLFNIVAESMAMAAIEVPGGIKAFGQMWEVAERKIRLIRKTQQPNQIRLIRRVQDLFTEES